MLHSTRDLAPPPGMTLRDGGAEFAVYAGHAEAVSVSLFDADGRGERSVPLLERAHGWWFGELDGVGVGQRYAVRAKGRFDPGSGLRYDDRSLLLDPYAKAIDGRLGVVIRDSFDWGNDHPLQRPWTDTVIYETHVRALTMLHPDLPAHLRGTYAGLAHPVVIEHLRRIGVTAVELLPIHAFASEPALLAKGLSNFWGYNSMSFFAPEPRYAAAADPQGQVDELKGMVKLLHQAGIEVILDVVYNHTAEQGQDGESISWRGLDNRAYYRLDGRGYDVDVTGCGNTIDMRHPVACRQVLESLRYWVQECHVDGFRFDLAVALARGRNDDYDPDHPFLVALRTDPVLSRAKLIAEPWDVGMNGWRTGQFPPPFAEWNDRFRDDVRTFWLTDTGSLFAGQTTHGVRDLATRLAGSEDLFGSRDRGPIASINFIAAHDGFTTADLTAYNEKHNEANGEGNRDGTSHNRSWNHGIEGPCDDETVLLWRRRSIRNLLGTLLFATGVPMLAAGDEFGRTQHGNNNPYCQDNELTWFGWDHKPWQQDLAETLAYLTSLRRQHPVLRQRHFFSGREVHPDGSTDLAWYDVDGRPMSQQRWDDESTRVLQMQLNGARLDHNGMLIVINGGIGAVTVNLAPGRASYRKLWDSDEARPSGPGPQREPGPVSVAPCSIQLWGAEDGW